LDLPLLLKQERISTEIAQQTQGRSIPEQSGFFSDISQPVADGGSDEDVARLSRATGSVRSGRNSRVTDPVFLRRSGPTSVPIFDPIQPEQTARIDKSKRKLAVVLVAFLLVSGGVGAAVLKRNSGYDDEAEKVAKTPAAVLVDAGAKEPLLTDPVLLPMPTLDAAVKQAVMDAGSNAARDRNRHKGSVTLPLRGNNPPQLHGDLEVTIITRPRGGRLVIDNAYAGSDGLNLRRKMGSKLTVHCRLSGYRDGSTNIVFDGKREVFLCRLREIRTKRCVEGMKNPFDDCP